jgi:cell division protein ZapA (FtsZ GTPase activity inhibitor)
MKRILLVVTAVAASLLLNAAAVLAIGNIEGIGSETQFTTEKDECLLVAKNCTDELLTVNQRIDHLNAEIDKGAAVYTNEELGVLQMKLDSAYKELQFMKDEGY